MKTAKNVDGRLKSTFSSMKRAEIVDGKLNLMCAIHENCRKRGWEAGFVDERMGYG